eukprot:3172922-Pyramimonas_sp.AAC.2
MRVLVDVPLVDTELPFVVCASINAVVTNGSYISKRAYTRHHGANNMHPAAWLVAVDIVSSPNAFKRRHETWQNHPDPDVMYYMARPRIRRDLQVHLDFESSSAGLAGGGVYPRVYPPGGATS